MSRSSSGFESGHLLSPEHSPQTTTSSSKPDLPCSSTSERPPKKSTHLPRSPEESRVPVGAISRSQSCTELRDKAASQPVRRSLSLTVLCKDQKRQNTDLKNQHPTSSLQTEGSTQDSGNVHQLTSPSPQPSTTQHDTVSNASYRDTVKVIPSEEKEPTQDPQLQPPADVSKERSDPPPLTASALNPHEESFPTESVSVCHTNRVLSANLEARRLKKKRDKTNCVNIGSPVGEKL